METLGKKILVFGVFDNLHDGHRFLLEKAQKYGANLYIAVTPTKAVQNLKSKLPFYSIKERMHALQNEYPNAIIFEGDTDHGKWTPITKYKPNTVVCGYDQTELHSALKKISEDQNFQLIQIKDNLNGTQLHSSLIHQE